MVAAENPRWVADTQLAGAAVVAITAHAHQARKTHPDTEPGIPYISHLMAVSALVTEYGGTALQAAAGLLHDVIEDTDMNRQKLIAKVGDEIAAIVLDCSHHTEYDDEVDSPYRTRKQDYLDHLSALVPGNPAVLVSLADKTHNAESSVFDLGIAGITREQFFSRFGRANGEVDVIWWYDELVKVFRSRTDLDDDGKRLLSRFETAVRTIKGDTQ